MTISATQARLASSIVADRLRITEIFCSIQGESSLAGWPTVFVRLTGCPLRCQYCDTAYAFYGKRSNSHAEILEEIERYRVRHVCVTGGEPLAQRQSLTLLRELCERGYVVSLETSGAIDISPVDPRVRRILDIKTPGSGEVARNLWGNMAQLRDSDEVKFVLCDRADFDWAREVTKEHRLTERCTVLFSPSAGQLEPRELAEWILSEGLPVRFQVQLHKYLWGNQPGR